MTVADVMFFGGVCRPRVGTHLRDYHTDDEESEAGDAEDEGDKDEEIEVDGEGEDRFDDGEGGDNPNEPNSSDRGTGQTRGGQGR